MIQSTWRLLVDPAKDAFLNMAVDEAVLMHCIAGKSAPTLILVAPSPQATIFGKLSDTETVLASLRLTGGGS